MKLFHRIPKQYHNLSVGILSALTIVTVGLMLNAMLPKPDPVSDAGNSNAETAAGISVTPVDPNQAAGDAPLSPDSAAPGTGTRTPEPNGSAPESAASPPSPISPEAIAAAPDPSDIDGYAEPYDDVVGLEYGHFPYAQADPSRIESVGLFERESYEREEFLDYEAVAAFNQMRAAAEAEGVYLIPISGFRTIQRQAELFASQVEKQGSEAAAAQLSAPPGHSEHHTGYAIDIGDANSPDTDIKYAFENTPAYQWLKANAQRYGFEESFPYGNPQGVSFEPWHWRFVGSERAQQTFIHSRPPASF